MATCPRPAQGAGAGFGCVRPPYARRLSAVARCAAAAPAALPGDVHNNRAGATHAGPDPSCKPPAPETWPPPAPPPRRTCAAPHASRPRVADPVAGPPAPSAPLAGEAGADTPKTSCGTGWLHGGDTAFAASVDMGRDPGTSQPSPYRSPGAGLPAGVASAPDAARAAPSCGLHVPDAKPSPLPRPPRTEDGSHSIPLGSLAPAAPYEVSWAAAASDVFWAASGSTPARAPSTARAAGGAGACTRSGPCA